MMINIDLINYSLKYFVVVVSICGSKLSINNRNYRDGKENGIGNVFHLIIII